MRARARLRCKAPTSLRLQCKVLECDRTHADLRFSRSVIVCMSAKDDAYACPFSADECPYKNHKTKAGN